MRFPSRSKALSESVLLPNRRRLKAAARGSANTLPLGRLEHDTGFLEKLAHYFGMDAPTEVEKLMLFNLLLAFRHNGIETQRQIDRSALNRPNHPVLVENRSAALTLEAWRRGLEELYCV